MLLNIRNLVAVILALGILGGIVWATGGNRRYGTAAPTPTVAPVAEPTATTPPAAIHGDVTVSVTHLSGHTLRFRYVVHDVGSSPIAGFQLSGNPANLFHIVTPTGWGYMGSYCGQRQGGVLIYWSAPTARAITHGHSAAFGFDVNTDGTTNLQYSLAWENAVPQFSPVRGPLGSTLPASGPCGR